MEPGVLLYVFGTKLFGIGNISVHGYLATDLSVVLRKVR